MPIKTNKELVTAALNVVNNYKTLYVMGCFGAPLTGANVTYYCANHSYNRDTARTAMIKAAANKTPPVFGFDCACLIKGLLWGWSGDASKTYGGAAYKSNGVPDVNADDMSKLLLDISADFKNIETGEALWKDGHIGIYIGDGKAVECTPAWSNNVQITAVKNIGNISGLNGQTWTKHGKLPYITYETAMPAAPVTPPKSTTVTPPTSAPVVTPPLTPVATPPANPSDPAPVIWNYFKSKGLNTHAVAGIIGNLYAESGLIATNLQNSYEKSLGYNDLGYTVAVDSGAYTNFIKDSAGYGLAQWTHYTVKQGLLDYAKKSGKSIGDLYMQLEYLWQDLSTRLPGTLSGLKAAASVRAASDIFMLQYERPADQSEAAKAKRAAYGQGYYDKYAQSSATAPLTPPAVGPVTVLPEYKGYTVRVTADVLNIRKGPGTNYDKNGAITDRGIYTIVEEATGPGAVKWGKLKSGKGWIALDYAVKA